MSAPWWTPEAGPQGDDAAAKTRRTDTRGVVEPLLVPGNAETTLARLLARAPEFTPEWTRLREDDPGVILARLFAEQVETLRELTDLLPQKCLVETLRIAGAEREAASPAQTLVVFEVSPAARAAVPIPARFGLEAPAADGSGDDVVFETEASLWATAATIAEVRVEEGGLLRDVSSTNDDPEATFDALGSAARAGDGLWIGLDDAGPVGPTLSLGLLLAPIDATPEPVSHGGLVPLPVPPRPRLVWEVWDRGWSPMAVIRDETAGLSTTGVVELATPERWHLGRPSGLPEGDDRRWLRLRVARGRFPSPPRLRSVVINCTRAIAARTILDEVLDPPVRAYGLPPELEDRRRLLRHTPVIPGTLILDVDDGRELRTWTEVAELASAEPDDEVYVLDEVTGELRFGDGRHGAPLPPGFRNVVARHYRVGGGRAGAIEAEAIAGLRSAAPFVTDATNPIPASGGVDLESRAAALIRAPKQLRTFGRAVAGEDYELLARRVPGARVGRVRALSGYHPSYPGPPIPGVVGLLVVASEGSGEDRSGPPIPSSEDLRAVARHVARELAPAGVEIVAASPRFQAVHVEATIFVSADRDPSAVVSEALEHLDTWLDPLVGGDDGQGWPFGGAISQTSLTRRLLRIDGVRAVERMTVVIDGFRSPGCDRHALDLHALPWPGTHELFVRIEEDRR